MKRVALPVIAAVVAAALAAVAGWPASDNEAWAQRDLPHTPTDLPAPDNLQVVNGDNPGEVFLSWEAVAGASGYDIRWIDNDAAQDAFHAGHDWQKLILSYDVEGSETTTHTLRVSNPATGLARYQFGVGSKSNRDAEPANWSPWQALNVRGDTDPDVRALAAALSISRRAGKLVALSGPARFGMRPEYLRQSEAELAGHRTALAAELEVLAGTGYAGRARRITGLANELVSNAELIQQLRPPLLTSISAGVRERQLLTRDVTTKLLPAAETTADEQFYQLLAAIPDGGPADSGSFSTDDVLRYAHMRSLLGNLGPATSTLLATANLQVPSLAGRVQELYETAAIPVERDIEYLSENGGPEFEELIELTGEVLAVAAGESNIFDRLQRRLRLAAAESALISKNNDILDRLLFEIDALAADVQGHPQPSTMPGEEAGERGVTDDEIRFGQSAALMGPAAALGEGMRLGIQAAFKEANDTGGVHGRRLTLKTLNDDYETVFAFANTQLLIDRDRVFGLIGAVGTPTSRAALPLAEAKEVPFVGAFTGAQLLRGSGLTNVLNVRASYHDETERMVEYLESMGRTRVAVLYQNDSYGQDGLAGVQKALDKRGMTLASSWYYSRNTSAVKAAVFRIARAEPDAVVIIGAYAPTARAIQLLRTRLTDAPVFMAVSFVGSNALKDELARLGESTTGVYVTQVVPLPSDGGDRLVAAYRAALSAYDADAEPGFVSLEGYLAGRLAIKRLEACSTDVTRECFLDVMSGSASIDLDGFQLEYGPGDNQGSEEVYLTAINQAGEYERVNATGR